MPDKTKHGNGIEMENGLSIYDNAKNDGIILIVPVGAFEGNMYAQFFMSDEQAEDLITIIQNKLNGRLT